MGYKVKRVGGRPAAPRPTGARRKRATTKTSSGPPVQDPNLPKRRTALVTVLRRQLGPHRAALVGLLILQAAQTAATLYLPALNADIIDRGVLTGDTGYIWRVGRIMAVVSILQVICAIGAVFIGSLIATEVARSIRRDLFVHVMALSSREVADFGTPTLITRTTNDVQQLQQFVLMTLTMVVAAPIVCVGGILLATRQDAPLSLVLLAALPTLAVIIRWNTRRMLPLSRQMQKRLDGINTVLREQIGGVRVVRAFVRDTAERDRFEVANRAAMDVSYSMGRLMSLMFPILMLVVNLTSVAVVWFGGHRIASGAMPVGALTAYLAYVLQIFTAVMMSTFLFMQGPRAAVSSERIMQVLDTESTVVAMPTMTGRGPEPGHLDLRGVGFRYPGAQDPVLHDVSLVARPGQTTAIIGSTGSGKTTLINLIPRLTDATSGDVVVEGANVRALDRTALSRAVGLVPQSPYLFAGSIGSNLRYGDPDATDADLWRALEIAQAAAFVRELPDGLDAEIAQGGTNVSGGQRQRLAIARALVGQPAIYLFDDSFSALDYATDAALRDALVRHLSNATVVIVAQRVSTIRTADRIVVLDEGRVVDTGPHEALMSRCTTYREIVLSQLSAAEAGVAAP